MRARLISHPPHSPPPHIHPLLFPTQPERIYSAKYPAKSNGGITLAELIIGHFPFSDTYDDDLDLKHTLSATLATASIKVVELSCTSSRGIRADPDDRIFHAERRSLNCIYP